LSDKQRKDILNCRRQ